MINNVMCNRILFKKWTDWNLSTQSNFLKRQRSSIPSTTSHHYWALWLFVVLFPRAIFQIFVNLQNVPPKISPQKSVLNFQKLRVKGWQVSRNRKICWKNHYLKTRRKRCRLAHAVRNARDCCLSLLGKSEVVRFRENGRQKLCASHLLQSLRVYSKWWDRLFKISWNLPALFLSATYHDLRCLEWIDTLHCPKILLEWILPQF